MCFEFSCVYTGVKLLDHIVTLHLTFSGIAKLFSVVASSFYIPTSNVWGAQCLHSFTNMCYCSYIIAILVVMKWSLVVLIWISLITNNVGHLFMCLLAICNLFGKLYFQIVCTFFNGPFLLMNHKSSLYLLCIRVLSDIWFAKTFCIL